MTPDSTALAPILHRLRSEPSRTGSIIVTVYGDAVAPRGGSLWLGTLLVFFEALGIGGGVVRTAVSRLATEGLLERERLGRRSFYRLSPRGREMFAAAAARIYGAHEPAWDGCFRLALLAPGAEREAARSALEAAGYAAFAPGTLVGLAPAPDSLAAEGVVRLSARAEAAEARRLAALLWPTERVAEGYRRFLATFAPLAADGAAALAGLDALVARVMLIHEYRRVVLRDPLLPAALLPEDWPGEAARRLCARLWRALQPESERWLDANGVCEAGTLPPPDAAFHARFAG